ncbi:hypothetical protein AB0J90_29805 [Micromonospora sp. NPDC049523]|uniref:RNA polymerase sigma factor n=1 Tax=Micromonospora sp. NPDC049523 TaxID=3155921 RepID=UPI0034219E57
MKVLDRATPVHDDEQLIEGFLAGDPGARIDLPKRFGPRIRRIAQRSDVRLARLDLAEEVEQQLYLLLLTRPAGHFDRTRCDGVWGYLRAMTRLAARDVLAQYAPPGTRTRAHVSPEPNSHVKEAGAMTSRQVLVEDRPSVAVAEDVALGQVVSEMIMNGLEAEAPSWLRHVLRLVVEGLTVTEAAAVVGRSRFAVRRALGRWAKPAATLAALEKG